MGTPRRRLVWLVALLLLVAGPAAAHQSSVVYLQLDGSGRTVEATIRIADTDVGAALGVSGEGGERGERAASQAEVEASRARLFAYLTERVRVAAEGQPCPATPRELRFAERAGGFFVRVGLDYVCPRRAAALTVDYDLFFDLDPRHQAFARLSLDGGEPRQHVFHASARHLAVDRPVTLLDHVGDYLRLGVEHIFTGYDHLAFLVGLLLAVGFVDWRRGLRQVVGIVTAFTVAHSLTLIASGLDLLRVPARVVEPAIALSIAYVAVGNLRSARPAHRWLVTFVFGLIHGCGFASVLREVGLPARGMVISLLSFNLGVELGQLTVVLLVAPLLIVVARRGQADRLRLMGSAVLLVLAIWWFIERLSGR